MDWLRYANQGATRNLPLSNDLASALNQFIPNMGLQVEVFSGGQPTAGNGARVGSVRHDHGNAADVFFYRGNERLDWSNPNHLPVFQDIVRQGRAAGLTGFGAGPGYMRPGSMHIGFGAPGVWGADGRSANAPGWLAEAFSGAQASPRTQVASAPTPPAAPEGLAGMFAGIDPAALMTGRTAPSFGAPKAPAAYTGPTASPTQPMLAQQPGALTGDPGGVMSGLAMQFMQGQRERQQRQREYEAAEQERRTALLSSAFV